MRDRFPTDLGTAIRSYAAASRAELEEALFPRPRAGRMLFDALMRGVAVIALGIFAAGVAIFGVAIVLNLVFHYAPT